MRRWAVVSLFVLAAAAFADGTAAPVAPAAPAAPVAPSAPVDPVKSLAARCRYVPVPFEMKVSEAVTFGASLVVEGLEFRSPVVSVDPEKNDVVHGKLFRTAKPEPAAVIVLGGWRYDPITPALGARLAEETGLQVLYLELPFQGARTPTGRRTGEMTFSADLEQNLSTFAQAAQDVGRAVDWLVRERQVDAKRLGILGTSLGGYVASDLYGLDDRFSAAVIQISGGDIASVVFNGNRLTQKVHADLAAKGIGEAAVREAMRPLDPTTWAREVRKDGILFIAAELDEVVSLPTVKTLAAAYGGARLVVMPGAHHIDPERLKEHFPEAVKHFRERLLPKSAAPALPAPATPATPAASAPAAK